VFTYLIATTFLSEEISRNIASTIWDYVSYWIWEIKGIFGIGTGLLLLITSLLRRHAD
jgi:hypothetical protein